jgi:hypothetical protein
MQYSHESPARLPENWESRGSRRYWPLNCARLEAELHEEWQQREQNSSAVIDVHVPPYWMGRANPQAMYLNYVRPAGESAVNGFVEMDLTYGPQESVDEQKSLNN